jgi:hypothetical protein
MPPNTRKQTAARVSSSAAVTDYGLEELEGVRFLFRKPSKMDAALHTECEALASPPVGAGDWSR